MKDPLHAPTQPVRRWTRLLVIGLVLTQACVRVSHQGPGSGGEERAPVDRACAQTLANARSLLDRDEVDAAHAVLAGLAARAPSCAEVWRWLAHASVRMDDHGSALLHLDRALALRPDDVWTHYARGVSQKELQRYEAAIESFSQALSRDPAHAKSRVHRAHARRLVGDRNAAREDLEAALTSGSLDPNDLAWVQSVLAELTAEPQ
jgi:tetratricopeptide (TPR) repeat protein